MIATTRRTLLRAAGGLVLAAPAIVRAQTAWPSKQIARAPADGQIVARDRMAE